jgi:flagellar brake protein
MRASQPISGNAEFSSGQKIRDNEDYCTTSSIEILFILNAILAEKSLLTLYLGRSRRFLLTSILAIDSEKKELIMDCGVDESLNQLAQKSENLMCVTTQKRIKIEFNCFNLKIIHFEGHNAFRLDLPGSLKRIQRREFYRIATPVTNPATCSISLSQKDGKKSVEFNLSDISCGGMALLDQQTDLDLDPGTVFKHCQINLQEFGVIETNIQIRNAHTTILNNGISCQHAGCEFIGLPEKSRALIQRYISKLEQQARKFRNNNDF